MSIIFATFNRSRPTVWRPLFNKILSRVHPPTLFRLNYVIGTIFCKFFLVYLNWTRDNRSSGDFSWGFWCNGNSYSSILLYLHRFTSVDITITVIYWISDTYIHFKLFIENERLALFIDFIIRIAKKRFQIVSLTNLNLWLVF